MSHGSGSYYTKVLMENCVDRAIIIPIQWSMGRRLDKPVANRFNSEGHSLEDLSSFVIEQIHQEEANFRKAKESYWIQTPRLLAPEGLNLGP